MRIILFIIISLIVVADVSGQFRQTDQRDIEEYKRYSFEKPFNTWALTFTYGPMIMYTDITEYSFVPKGDIDFGASVTLSKQLAPAFAFDFQFVTGDTYGRFYDRYFEGHLNDFTINGVLFINQLGASPGPLNDRWNFYLKAGGGLVFFRNRLYIEDQNILERAIGYDEDGNKTSREMEIIIPVSAGVQYRLNRNFDLGLESSMRFCAADNLDNVLTGSSNDRYLFTGINLSYKIGRKDKRHMRWTYRGYGFNLFGRPARDPLANEVDRLEQDINNFAADRTIKKDSVSITESLTLLYRTMEFRTIFYPKGQKSFDADDIISMAESVVLMKHNPGAQLELYGYVPVSDHGDHAELSRKQCEKVKDFLVNELAADAGNITIIPRGSDDPLAREGVSSSDAEITINRRVDMVLKF